MWGRCADRKGNMVKERNTFSWQESVVLLIVFLIRRDSRKERKEDSTGFHIASSQLPSASNAIVLKSLKHNPTPFALFFLRFSCIEPILTWFILSGTARLWLTAEGQSRAIKSRPMAEGGRNIGRQKCGEPQRECNAHQRTAGVFYVWIKGTLRTNR